MNAEKKLGLAFVGILSIAFCAVLTMRLLDANQAEQIDINVGPPVGSAPTFDPTKPDATKTDGSAMATSRPVAPAAPQPPEASRFAGGTSPSAPRSGSYLPPMSKSPTSPTGDSRYGAGATASATAGANPYGAAPAGGMTSGASPSTNPSGSTGSRYGTPTATSGSPANSTAGATAGMTSGSTTTPPTSSASADQYGTTVGAATETGSRYGAPTSPSTPAAPPSFGTATPTAAATLTPPASPSTAAAPSMSASSTMTASQSGSGDNPLRGSRPFDSTTTAGGTTPSLASGGAAAPNLPSAPAATSPAADPYSGSRYGTSAIPSAPLTATTTTTASASGSTSGGAREPRPFDDSAVSSQPLRAATAPSASATTGLNPAPSGGDGFNTGFANTNTLRSSSPTASPAGGLAAGGFASGGVNSGNVATGNLGASGNVAPAAAAMPVAAPAVKNTPYVVQPDDNFWNISQKVYGDGSYYRALFAYNSDRYAHAEDVRAGSVLDVPPAEVLKQRYPELVGGAVGGDGRPTDASLAGGRPAAAGVSATYTVREGDTLFDIARRQLGKASRWNEIYELNRSVLGENLENLRPGMQIQLPQ